jgi:hypothetical protein
VNTIDTCRRKVSLASWNRDWPHTLLPTSHQQKILNKFPPRQTLTDAHQHRPGFLATDPKTPTLAPSESNNKVAGNCPCRNQEKSRVKLLKCVPLAGLPSRWACRSPPLNDFGSKVRSICRPAVPSANPYAIASRPWSNGFGMQTAQPVQATGARKPSVTLNAQKEAPTGNA